MQEFNLPLIDALLNPACYAHPVEQVELVETHISWVFLAGNFAYKLKKPVNFGFLDFSTLEKRLYFCSEELRLNRRFAPQLYLEVISIGGTLETPILGETPALEYAVKMKCFPRSTALDVMIQQKNLHVEQMNQFADYIAKIHQQAPLADQQRFGSPEAIFKPVRENFSQLLKLLPGNCSLEQVIELDSWSRTTFDTHRLLMKHRREQGYVRECHGDLHLANMVWLDGQPILFDCIEFNENFRWIDIINDIAFLLMDLDDRSATSLGWHFINRYLQQTGDYAGLPLLNFYKTYRAMVRAKVTRLRLSQAGLSKKERDHEIELLKSYLNLATSYCVTHKPLLLICHGFSGSGKSTYIEKLAPLIEAISINSDVERKRLHGLQATESSDSQLETGIYSAQSSTLTYNRLIALAEIIINSGFSVIIDATFLEQKWRNQAQQLASKHCIPMVILDFPLCEEELFQRVIKRAQQTRQVSEANATVLRWQIEQSQPLTMAEEQISVQIGPYSSLEITVAEIKARSMR